MISFSFVDDLNIESMSDEMDVLLAEPSLERLEAEEAELLSELYEIKKRLKEIEEIKANLKKDDDLKLLEIETVEPHITQDASIEDKAEFVLDLFMCRRDVYSLRKWNAETGKAQYYPKCFNSWTPVCPKLIHKESGKKGPFPKCTECKEKKFAPLNKYAVIGSQFKNDNPFGVNALGIYTVFDSDKCGFIAIDFDEGNWKAEVLAVANTFRKAGFQAAIEISFSGNGAHLWLFFSEPVLASKARRLAMMMLDRACSTYKDISFRSYDRIFPLQDHVDENSLGNLILMPLVLGGVKKEQKGTVFVDNSFNMYPDQIAFLSSVPRYTEEDIDRYLESADNVLSIFTFKNPDDIDVLQKTKAMKISKMDILTSPLPLYLSSGISIPKCSLSPKAEDALKRLSTFSNPEYFLKKRAGDGFIPNDCFSYIPAYVESDTVLQLPRGLKDVLARYLEKQGIPFEMIDKRYSDAILDVQFVGELRDEQTEALEAMEKHEIGIMKAATSFGKTITAAKLIAKKKEKTLILVSSSILMKQWEKELRKHIIISNPPQKRDRKRVNKYGIGVYGGSMDSLSGYVDVAMLQSLSSKMPEFIREYGLVIVDECHHVAADSFVKVMQKIRAKYVYGLSATDKRSDGLEKIVYSQCGNVRYVYSAAKLASKRGVIQTCVPRFTSFIAKNIGSRLENQTELLAEIAKDDSRNTLICNDVEFLLGKNRKILILTKLKEHVHILSSKLMDRGISNIVLTGSMSKTEIREAKDRISSRNDGYNVVISTGKFLGEGADIPYLDTLLVVMPVSWEGILSQYAGRISRTYKDKSDILIYDYVDICVKQFSRMYAKRVATYKHLGFSINEDINPYRNKKDEAYLYSGRSFFSEDEILMPILNAIRQSKTRVIISSQLMYPSNSTKEISEALLCQSQKGVSVVIVTKSPDNSSKKELQEKGIASLKESGLKIIANTDNYLDYMVIDDSELWFGNISLLSNLSNHQECEERVMLHIFNSDAVKSLVESNLLLL